MKSGFRRAFDPPGLDRPGRQLHQQGLSEARLGWPRRVTPGTLQGRHQYMHFRMDVQRYRRGGTLGLVLSAGDGVEEEEAL